MNSLSWILYFAGVADNLQTIFIILGLIAGVCAITMGIPAVAEGYFKPWVLFLPTIPLILACIIPSKETMYAIAVSEMGEDVYKSALGQKAAKALEAFIDKQLPKVEVKE